MMASDPVVVNDERAGTPPSSISDRAIPESVIDIMFRQVRATGVRGGFVDFEFTLGDPLLTVALVMPPEAFVDFCAEQGATISMPQPVADLLEARGLRADDARSPVKIV